MTFIITSWNWEEKYDIEDWVCGYKKWCGRHECNLVKTANVQSIFGDGYWDTNLFEGYIFWAIANNLDCVTKRLILCGGSYYEDLM